MLSDAASADPLTSESVAEWATQSWEHSLKAQEGRVPDLFRTEGGLKGHVQQLQNELNRLHKASQLDGTSSKTWEGMQAAEQRLHDAVAKTQEFASRADPVFGQKLGLEFKINQLYL